MLVTLTKKNLVASTKNFGSPKQKFGCHNPHHFLIGLTKNEGSPDQNLRLTQPNWCLVAPTLTKVWKRLQNFYECRSIIESVISSPDKKRLGCLLFYWWIYNLSLFFIGSVLHRNIKHFGLSINTYDEMREKHALFWVSTTPILIIRGTVHTLKTNCIWFFIPFYP